MPSTGSASSAPLAGVTVVALEQAVSAPMCSRTLADFGARVIKVESPHGGDLARSLDTVVNGLAAHFVWVNRGKESVTLDLKTPQGMDILFRLIETADVLLSNLAPGAGLASVRSSSRRGSRTSSPSRSTDMDEADRSRTSGLTTYWCKRSQAHAP
jgi:crotonobetainyl-CoA:carnitine CoA-transferase CaiB-like acyl-CoA transferase